MLLGFRFGLDLCSLRRTHLQLLVAEQTIIVIQGLLAQEKRVALILVWHQLLIADIVYLGSYRSLYKRRQRSLFGNGRDRSSQRGQHNGSLILFARFLLECFGEEIAAVLVLGW